MSGGTRKPRAGTSRQTGAPTIADVAKLAGVSLMTVSRVINAEANVRDATREAVQAAIVKLNYAPNRAARRLAGAVQLRIGLFYSNPSEAYLSAFLLGSLDQASRSDIQLVVQHADPHHNASEVARRFIESGVDGIILPPPLCDSREVLDLLAAAGVPTIAVATGSQPDHVASVSIDDRGAAREMTEHLLRLGHERIGFIIGDPNLAASGERLEGYREALRARDIVPDDALIAQGYFTYRSGLDAAEQLLEIGDPPSAIFASNDDMAAATVAVAHRRGMDVPGDLTVVGFDDSALATTIWPELTTIHQPIAEMSRAAMQLLITMLQSRRNGGTAPPQHQVLDYTLVRRQSDAAPRRRPRPSVRKVD
ncbi:LacI family DNA-binding transcriptional regulator [Stakelama tenebrarum]|uniref:LacI family transcriptional regulator n=1 Tax=Stakelama tenebrarum TaxID=2711215 RepID=A0A6G6Y5T9_9SPHN|nr:LacI family DNA-binding transcriptional regulator [Sphingosinithalassobacter tenebrarum]QIG80211.1 LacI family transcriptional regulator [Sphingosinithalassobacter tenebrarum]